MAANQPAPKFRCSFSIASPVDMVDAQERQLSRTTTIAYWILPPIVSQYYQPVAKVSVSHPNGIVYKPLLSHRVFNPF
jgi:hypothetical protein